MAANASGDLGLLTANAERAIRDLRRAVGGAKAQDGRRGTRFLELVDAALDALEARVHGARDMETAARDASDRRAAARFARRINYDLRLLHQAAPWVESARQGSLGLGLVYFVDEMVSGLLKDDADVVMSSTANYMYSTVYDIPKWLEVAFNVAVPDGPTAIVIAYPIHEPDSLFLHLLIAHELGHSVVPSAGLVATTRALDSDKQKTEDGLGEAVEQFRIAHKTTKKEATLQVRMILDDWLTELLCDALALAFLGPSFLFTYAAFSTPFDQAPSESHPPFGLRTEALMTHLDSAGWRSIADSVAPRTVTWISKHTVIPRDPQYPYLETIEKVARHLFSALISAARDHVGDAVFKFDEGQVDELVRLLAGAILPAQVGDSPAERRSIILAGWLHAFSRARDDEPAALAEITGERAHQRFLTKALEMSIVLDKWGNLA